MLNADRARAGLQALTVDVRMLPAARGWSWEQLRSGAIRHHPDLRTQVAAGATAWAENVGATTDPAAAGALHGAFMASEGHRSAILNGTYTEVAVGVATDGPWTYVTQRFSAGAPAYVAPAVEPTARLAVQMFDGQQASHAVIVRDDAFPDALTAGPLAGTTGPIMLTPPGPTLHPAVAEALDRTVSRGRTVYVIGGENALPDAILGDLSAGGWNAVRLWGRDRVGAAATVADEMAATNRASDTVLIATAADWPDASAAAAFGARLGAPVLLVNRDEVPQPTWDVLRRLQPSRIIALGGQAAISDGVVSALGAIRIASSTRQGTAAAIARDVWGRRDAASTQRWTVVPESADGWMWALPAAPLAARLDAPMLLAGDRLHSPLTDYLRGLGYQGDAHAELAINGPVPRQAVDTIAALVS